MFCSSVSVFRVINTLSSVKSMRNSQVKNRESDLNTIFFSIFLSCNTLRGLKKKLHITFYRSFFARYARVRVHINFISRKRSHRSTNAGSFPRPAHIRCRLFKKQIHTNDPFFHRAFTRSRLGQVKTTRQTRIVFFFFFLIPSRTRRESRQTTIDEKLWLV